MSDAIHDRPVHRFRDLAAQRDYYEKKYATGGYDRGYTICGVDLSRIYQERREAEAWGLINFRPELRALDVGCGRGAFAARLAAHCAHVTGIDVAGNAFADENRLPNVSFRGEAIEELNGEAGAFDLVTCLETVEHLMQPDLAIQKMSRVLAGGGQLVMTYPLINRTLVKRLGLGRKLPISEHLNEWSFDELVFNLSAHGLQVEAYRSIAFDFGYLLYLKALNARIARALTTLMLAVRGFPRNSQFVALRCRKF